MTVAKTKYLLRYALVLITALAAAEGVGYREQRQILLQFYHSTGGRHWRNTTNWPISNTTDEEDEYVKDEVQEVNFCNWYGILCTNNGGTNLSAGRNDTGVITGINLRANNLTGTLPWVVFMLPKLSKLILASNQIISIESVSRSKFLENTTYADNEDNNNENSGTRGDDKDLTIHTDVFENRTDNENKNMDQNVPLSSLNIDFQESKTLVYLDISKNNISSQVDPLAAASFIFSQLGIIAPELKYVNLSNNRLGGTLPSNAFSSLPNLVEVDLSYQKAKPAPLSGSLPSFENMTQLEVLNLAGNELNGTIPTTFFAGLSDPTKFVSINLASNRVTGSIPLKLARLTRLDLHLQNNRITHIPSALCSSTSQWMNNTVSRYGCRAILCPLTTYNKFGRQFSDDTPCKNCYDNVMDYYGRTTCDRTVIQPMTYPPNPPTDLTPEEQYKILSSPHFWGMLIIAIITVSSVFTCCAPDHSHFRKSRY